ncbi:hypothetical protein [Prosthecobacter sp.]|jgi:hypothetical protein|uniref:hypothetical protein n=1 Tax=Prosthecobacter sp. TaxID=1965333 RepID=UPI003784665E
MTAPRILTAALLTLSLLTPSCLPERVDSRYPTISQQDAYDVSWGLPPRKSRGNPKLRYQYNARQEEISRPLAVPQAAAPAPEPAPARSAAPAPAPISPTLPSNSPLR